jgi:hypothetical protein
MKEVAPDGELQIIKNAGEPEFPIGPTSPLYRVRPVNHIFTKIRGRARLLGASSSRHSAAERQCPASPRTEANARQVKPKAGPHTITPCSSELMTNTELRCD